MREVRNKRLVLAGLAVLALLLIGTAAFALFRETLRAVIEVQTGDFNVDFVGVSVKDNERRPQDPEIGNCTARVNPNNVDEIIVEISNAYPRYECEVNATVRNVGTIHARFNNSVIRVSDDKIAVDVVRVPQDVIAPNEQANVVFKVAVKDGAMENRRYNATVQFIFRQALPHQP